MLPHKSFFPIARPTMCQCPAGTIYELKRVVSQAVGWCNLNSLSNLVHKLFFIQSSHRRIAQSQKKSLEGQSALKMGRMEAMFDFIITEMDLQSEICFRFELEKRCWAKNRKQFLTSKHCLCATETLFQSENFSVLKFSNFAG